MACGFTDNFAYWVHDYLRLGATSFTSVVFVESGGIKHGIYHSIIVWTLC
jgi:hypothetical protein